MWASSRSSVAQEQAPLVSMAVWMPRARQPRSTASAKSGCIVTSPPVSVTPPPECGKKGFMRAARAIDLAGA